MAPQVLNRIEKGELVDLLRALVRIPSTNQEGEAEVSGYIADWARGAGLEVELDEVLPGRPNVYLWVRGEEGRPRLIFNGHTDVVPVGEGWSHPPFGADIASDHLYGRGSSDMKGGLAAMLIAAKAINESGQKLKGELALTAVIDEESGCAGTPQTLKRGIIGDFAVVGEPTGLEAVIASKGDVNVEVTTYGRAAHSSRPEEGVNAIYKMTRVVQAIETTYTERLRAKRHPLLGHPTASIDTIEGGITPWIIPERCRAMIDRRTIPGENAEIVIRELDDLFEPLKKEDPEFRLEMTIKLNASSAEIAPEEDIVRVLRTSAAKVLGRSISMTGMSGTTDARFLINDAKMPTIIFGPGDISTAHKPDENVSLTEVCEAAQIYTLVALGLLT